MSHKIPLNNPDNKTLTQSVLQASEMLSLYHAELARILHVYCSDIGKFSNGKNFISENSISWQQAVIFINFYNLLFDYCKGDEVKMRHWLRVKNDTLGDSPFILIVDKHRLEDVMQYLTKISYSDL